MAIELGSAYISILPEMKGFKTRLQGGLGKEGIKAGKQVGDDIGKGMEDGAKKGTKKVSGALKAGLAGVAVAAGGAISVGMFKGLIDEASDAQQSIGATEAIFGKYSDQVIKKSKEAAQAQGMSANEYRENGNLIAALWKNQGVAADELADKTHTMLGVGADLSAMYGGTATEAVEALTGAYKGEYNSLEKYGISLTAATVNAEAMAVANVNSAKEWNALSQEQQAAAKQQATTNLIMEQSADAQGQAAREADTYAGQMQRLQASLANTKETLGTALLPVVTGFVEVLNKNVVPAIDGFITGMKEGHGWGGKVADVFTTVKNGAQTAFDYVKSNVVPVIQDFVEEFKNGEGAGGRLRDAIDTVKGALETAFAYVKSDVVPALQDMWQWVKDNNETLKLAAKYVGALGLGIVAYKGYVIAANAVTKAWTAITKAQIAVQKALNWVMKMNPIGLVIAAITALIGILVVAYNEHEGFRKLVDKVWKKVKDSAKGFTDWFTNKAWPAIKDIFGKVRNGVASIKDAFTRAKDGIKSTWRNIINAVSRPINTVIDKVNDFLRNLKNGLNKIPGVNLDGNWTIRKIILDTADATVGGHGYGAAQALATGGKVHGFSPTPTADNIPAWLTAGEYVLPVNATNRLRKQVGAGGLEALRRGMLPGYAEGGEVGVIGRLLNRLKKPFGDSWPGQVAKGVIGNLSPKKIWDKLMSMMGNVFGGNKNVNYGGPYGWAPSGMGWSSIWSRIKAVAPEAVMTSNYRPGAITASGVPSLHGQGRAVDIVSGDMASTFRKIRNLLPWSQLFYTPMGGQQIGYRDSIIARTHWDHIHAAFANGGLVPSLYDRGGAIQPGLSLVANKTGKPEQVLTNQQWQDIREGNGNTIIINGVDTDNTADVADELMFALRRTSRGKYNRRR